MATQHRIKQVISRTPPTPQAARPAQGWIEMLGGPFVPSNTTWTVSTHHLASSDIESVSCVYGKQFH